MVSRLATPGLFSGSKTTSRPESVTAERIFFALDLRVVEQVDDAGRRRGRLAHLRGRVLQVGDLRGLLDDVRLGQPEGLAEAVVEPLRQVAGQLQVLALVLADRDAVGLVEQDVRGLQDRVREQADGGAVGAALGRLVLELRHPAGLAEPGDAAQHPAQLRVLGHVRLDEQRGPLRVDPGGEQLRGGPAGALAQHLRVVLDGDRVQVDDAVERVVVVLQRHPLPHRA